MNSEIKVAGKPIMWRKNFVKGLIYVNQLIKGGSWIPDHEAYRRFGLHVLKYNAIKTATSKNIVEAIKNKAINREALSFAQMMRKRSNLTQVIYRTLTKVQSLLDKANDWSKDLGEQVDTCEFISWCNTTQKVTNIQN